ncbi:flagellar brake protein [Orenia marismortui]|uniref:flagellar brake protein n=1 Tax=Orenia marismortui TaxID=46469 RepID=UPI00037308A2|nr:flagellar brake domain-containing protein [Orenia marismortui]
MSDRNARPLNRFDLSRRLNINQNIELSINYGKYEGEYYSQIADIIDEKHFVINTPFSEGKVVNISRGMKFKVFTREKNGLYELPVRLVKRKVETTPLLVLELIGIVKKIQEREFFRLEIYQETKFTLIAENNMLNREVDIEELMDNYNSNKKNIDTAIIQDISASGLKMVTKKDDLSENQIIEIDFDFANLPFESIFARIVRVTKEVKSEIKRYSVGVEFIYQNKGDRDKLMQWLFSKQRELRRKGLI